jgi:flagellar hook-length control protein FliK
VAMTLPLFAAPPATAPAARPARAAGVDDAAGAFDAMLAFQSAEADGPGQAAAQAPAGESFDQPTPATGGQWPEEAVADVWAMTWMPLPQPAADPPTSEVPTAPAAAAFAKDFAIPPGDEPDVHALDSRDALSTEFHDDSRRRSMSPEVGAAVVAPGELLQSPRSPQKWGPAPEAGSTIDRSVAAAGESEVAASVTAPAAEWTTDDPGSSAAGETTDVLPAAAGRGTPAQHAEHPTQAMAGSARQPREPVKAAARAALTHAVEDLQAREPARATVGVRDVTHAVATPALSPATPDRGEAVAAPRTFQTSTGQATRPENAGTFSQVVAAAPPAESAPRANAEGHGPRDDQGNPARGRAAAGDRLATLPASMVFPGQTTLAAALDHAAPLGGAAATPSYVPATVGPQIVRAVHLQVAQGGGEMTLTLRPEHLGTVTLEVKVDQQRVLATLTAETPAVRGWVAAHAQDLRSGLAELGLQLDELVVRDEDAPRDHPRERPTPERRRRPDADEDGEFEVRL